MNTYCVYRHIRLDTMQPFYVGLGINMKRPFYTFGRSKDWNDIVNNHGYRVDIIIDELTKEQARLKEKEFIEIYGRLDNGTGILCNKNSGGQGGSETRIWTVEQRNKVSEKSKGRKHTEESIIKIKQKLKGRAVSQERIDKMLNTRRKSGWIVSDETRKKLSEYRKSNPNTPESFLKRCVDLGGKRLQQLKRAKSESKYWVYQLHPITKEVIKVFDGLSTAARELGISDKNLHQCTIGNRRFCGGFSWSKELKNGG